MIKLYDYFRSSASFRVRVALNLKGLDYAVIPIHLINNGGEQHTAQYKQVNPQALVPTLQDGNDTLTQSLAIIEYLNEKHPTPPLLPNDPDQRAWVRSFALQIAADIHPINNLRVLHYLTHELGVSEEKKKQWYQHWITLGFTALEKTILKANVSGRYCFGDTPTLADICLVPQMYNARRFAIDLNAFPTLNKIDEHCQQHPAFIKAWPDDKKIDNDIH